MTQLAAAPSEARSCPGCAAAMRRDTYGRKPLGTEELDLCFDCQAIWFDAYESSQLTPGAVFELFRAIEAGREGRAPRPLPAAMHCVACRGTLALTHDIQRNNRFVYYRCLAGHGRFTTFLQFLREKDFVRSVTPLEMEWQRATCGFARPQASAGRTSPHRARSGTRVRPIRPPAGGGGCGRRRRPCLPSCTCSGTLST